MIEIRERLVYREGRHELASHLAWAQLGWANAARKIGRQDEAARVACQAVQTLESEIGARA